MTSVASESNGWSCEADIRLASANRRSQYQFTGFLRRNRHLAHEVGSALPGMRFFDVRPDRCTGSQELIAQTARNAGCRVQYPTQPNDSKGELVRSRFDIRLVRLGGHL